MAYHDYLTGLVSKAGFEQQLQKLFTEAHTRQPHGLLYLDLDQFKVINDACGQVAGDELLRQLAMIMGGQVRESDILARLGGDEFAVLLPHCDIQHAVNIAELLLQAINDFHFTWQDKSFPICGSIGLVSVDGGTADIGKLLNQADLACYTAKELGRNRVHVFDREDRDMARRYGEMEWASRIRHALDEDRLVLFAQKILPAVATSSSVSQYELLVRMVDETGQLIPPGAFLRAAERYNLMTAVDRWVVKHAFLGIAQSKVGARQQGDLFFINLSASSFCDPTFYDFILQQLEETGVSEDRICFEMSETMTITNLQLAVAFIKRIREIGCHFALNKFGTGLSSFSYLKTIPVDYLKIDGTFIRNMVESDMDLAIIDAINSISHVAGVKTIAEYVETEEIHLALQILGVDFVQGAYLDSPSPWEE